MKRKLALAFILGIALCAGSTRLLALDMTYHVSLDTMALRGSTNTFGLDFQLLDGDGLNNSSAVVHSFSFSGGAPRGTPVYIGGGSGSLLSEVLLSDLEFYNEVFQGFIPGTLLTFDLTLDSTATGLTPDSFAFGIETGRGTAFDLYLQVDLLDAGQSLYITAPLNVVPAGVSVPDSDSVLMLPMAAAAIACFHGFGRRSRRLEMQNHAL